MTVKEVDEFPWEAQLGARALRGIAKMGWRNAQIMTRTERFYEVRNPSGEIILVAGVARWSFVRPEELWIGMAKCFTHNLRESLALTREAMQLPLEQYGVLRTEADTRQPVTQRFIEYMGFRPVPGVSIRPEGEFYVPYELTKCQ